MAWRWRVELLPCPHDAALLPERIRAPWQVGEAGGAGGWRAAPGLSCTLEAEAVREAVRDEREARGAGKRRAGAEQQLAVDAEQGGTGGRRQTRRVR